MKMKRSAGAALRQAIPCNPCIVCPQGAIVIDDTDIRQVPDYIARSSTNVPPVKNAYLSGACHHTGRARNLLGRRW
jgi:hypothetical protein